MRAAMLISLASLTSAVACGCGDDGTTTPPTVEPEDIAIGGVPVDACGVGFVHDGASGCSAVLPSEPCPPGLMAVPGDVACREIMSCGSGPWGDIAFDAATQHVDQAFTGASDGSIAAPWTTIGAAVTAAPPGGLVAIAAGSYVEDVAISGKAVRLHGVCPQLVELVATGAALATIDIRTGASGSELRGVAIVGTTIGILLSGSQDVLLEQLWVHDNALRGIDAESALGTTSCTVRASLIEYTTKSGVFAAGATVHVEASVVRDTIALDAEGGRGIVAQVEAFKDEPSVMNITGSLVERNDQAGVSSSGSEITVEATLVRDTLSDAAGFGGAGITIQGRAETGAPSFAVVRTSVFERNRSVGVFVGGSQATIEATVTRDTLATGQGRYGRGIGIQPFTDTTGPSFVTIRASLIANNLEFGVFVTGSDATIEGCLVTDTPPNSDGLYGDGVLVQQAGVATSALIEASGIDRSARAGVANFGALASIGNSQLRCNTLDFDGETFRGQDFTFDNHGGNGCGCPAPDGACNAVSTALEPPAPIE